MYMLRTVDLLIENRHILEEADEVDFLLVMHAHQVMVGLPRDRQDGGPVHLGIV